MKCHSTYTGQFQLVEKGTFPTPTGNFSDSEALVVYTTAGFNVGIESGIFRAHECRVGKSLRYAGTIDDGV